jgi:hypothetical protein
MQSDCPCSGDRRQEVAGTVTITPEVFMASNDPNVGVTVGGPAPQVVEETAEGPKGSWCCVTGANRGKVPTVMDVFDRAATFDMNGGEAK